MYAIVEAGGRQVRVAPKATVKVFDSLGHNAYWEDPAAVATQINPFLSGL